MQPASELKERKQALPRGMRMCHKHKDQELRLCCKTCSTPICSDRMFKDDSDEGLQAVRGDEGDEFEVVKWRAAGRRRSVKRQRRYSLV